ncbi:Signal transduction histidine kinase [Natronoarchaeum philippinense]|uniref:histidine kinase n=1 Tax=Natronoarchaeum philippinense TaxID=558529 RepID=A0A285NAE6_NATPI|nr:cache domain-containing protein [Natronoarchaeum philippinense]SNZ04641.1 Signal transduction histidine kinase [Natronoarchaeum philippinense]
MQLRRKFLLALVLVAVTIAGVLVITFDSQRDAAVESAQADAVERAELTASTIDQQLSDKQRTISVAAEHPAVIDHGSSAQHERLVSIREETEFDGVSVVAANGTMVALATANGSSEQDAVGQNYGDRQYVQRALAGEVSISEPFRARTGNRIVVVSAPIRSDGDIVGALNGAFYLADSALFQIIDQQRGADTSVEITAGGEPLYAGSDGVESNIRGSAAVDATGWTVTVERRQSAVTGQIRRLGVAQAVTGIVMLAAVALFGLWIYRLDIRQAERLRDQFRRIEAREYDSRVDLSGSTEWSEIGRGINRLTESLARREQMLLVLNRLLRHNLRNSLNVIVGRSGLIAAGADDGSETDERTREHAEEIRSAADELLDLSARARKTEALIADDRHRVGTPVDITAVVADRVAAFRDDNPEATVEVETPQRACAAIGTEFSTVLDELLSNTVDHAGPSPSVCVTVERIDADVYEHLDADQRWHGATSPRPDGGSDDAAVCPGQTLAGESAGAAETGTGSIELRVADDGPGVPPDERAVLSGEREIDPLHHTSGLGLWLTGWIVSQAGGSIQIDVDDGTTVVVRLPATPVEGDT